MNFHSTSISGPVEIKPKLIRDSRGYFFEAFRESLYHENGILEHFVQENQSFSRQGTLRGLHFQREPHAQAKLVRCLVGTIFDVAVDIRKSSPTFGQWVSCVLSDTEHNEFFVPVGFAHGFYVQSQVAIVSYKCGGYYNKEAEGSLRWDDPTVKIDWPIDPNVELSISEKDLVAPFFSANEAYFK